MYNEHMLAYGKLLESILFKNELEKKQPLYIVFTAQNRPQIQQVDINIVCSWHQFCTLIPSDIAAPIH